MKRSDEYSLQDDDIRAVNLTRRQDISILCLPSLFSPEFGLYFVFMFMINRNIYYNIDDLPDPDMSWQGWRDKQKWRRVSLLGCTTSICCQRAT
jgi:hypothetical protein